MAEKKELSKNRQALLDKVLELFEGKRLNWTKGWNAPGNPLAPVSGLSGTRYRGINNVLLWLTAIERGYQDNRWVTFHQIKENGWSFKKDADGSSLGTGAGVPVELFRYYDKSTKQDLDWKEFGKLTLDEQKKYWDENVSRIIRYYTVFNGDVVEGMPPLEKRSHITAEERHERAEQIIRAWNDKQCSVVHDGGNSAYYSPKNDAVHLPERTSFFSLEEYYGVALHEVGHATGHASRLNRDLSGAFGSEKYAKEELRAEFASMFMQQELELPMSEFHIKNHTAYLQDWGKSIKKDPNVLFDAVKDAGKMVTYVLDNAAGMESSLHDETVATVTTQSASAPSADGASMGGALRDMVSNMPAVAAPLTDTSASEAERQTAAPKKIKWKKGWTTVDSAAGGYVETSYEWFDFVPDMHLMKSKVQDVWYIGASEPKKEPEPKCLFFDESSAKAAFEQVKEFQRSEHRTRHGYNYMDISELREWIDQYGYNPVTGEESVWLFTATSLLEEKEKESGVPTISDPLRSMVSAIPQEVEIPSYAEQNVNAESPFLRAMLGEGVNE